MYLEKKIIKSYGLLTANSFYYKPERIEQVVECIEFAIQKGMSICPMGSAMSFSDVCLLNDGICLDIKGLNQIIHFDQETGVLIAQAGCLTFDVLGLTMPAGWYLSGLSGSLSNTLAGDISNNVNGKDSWKYGNFGCNVLSMKVVLADGYLYEINKENNADLFNAIIGGMGQLGIIVEVTLQLKPIRSVVLEIKSKRIPNLNVLINEVNHLDENKNDFFYAWIDAFGQNNHLGRGVMETATFAKKSNEEDLELFKNGLKEKNKIAILSPKVFWKLINSMEYQLTFKVFNALKYNLTSDSNNFKSLPFPTYQFPLVNKFPKWNLKFEPKGFHDFQTLFPEQTFREAYKELIYICRKFNYLPQLCAIRKHKADMFLLSFSGNGYSVSIGYPLKGFSTKLLQQFMNQLIATVIKYNGKINLGKYPYMTSDECSLLYPKYDLFMKIKNQYDPSKIFSSDASKRIFK